MTGYATGEPYLCPSLTVSAEVTGISRVLAICYLGLE